MQTVSDLKPYQHTTPSGQGGQNDYSTWTYSLAPPLINEGSNKVVPVRLPLF